MSRGPLARWAAALAVTALTGLVAPGVAPAAPRPAAQAPAAVGIRAIDQSYFVTRGGMWTMRLALSGAPADATVEAELYDRVDRDQYQHSLLGDLLTDSVEAFPPVTVRNTEVRPDGTRWVTLALSLNQTAEDGSSPGWQFLSRGLRVGVYPLDVRVVDADGAERGRVVVHVVRLPSGTEEGADDLPLTVAPIVRIGDGPTVDPQGEADPDPGVAGQVDDLTDGLTMGRALPLTLIPRPESIEALARDEEAESTLAALQTVARTRQVVDGPYVDVALSAWIDHGLQDELSRQRDRGNAILTEHLGRADSSTWDARSGITPAAAAALWPVGVRTLILGSGALGPDPVPGPVTITTGERSMEAVAPDPVLSGALTRRDDPVLASADFAAELALRALSTDGPHGIVLDPADGWLDNPANIALLDQVLDDPLSPARAATLAELLETVPPVGTRELPVTFSEDLSAYAERLGLARARLSSYASLVGPGTAEIGSLDQLLLLSGSADLDEEERSAYVESVLATTDDRFQAVRAPSRQTVTLTSSDGDVPLTLLNELEVPVTVRVELSADSRLDLGDVPETQVLQPGTNQLEIPVHARAPGDTTIDIAISTTDGVVDLDEVKYTVRSTAVPGIGVVLSVGAIAFLVVWWTRHILRARRAKAAVPVPT